MGKNVILEACPAKGSRQARESCFTLALCLIVKRCFLHDKLVFHQFKAIRPIRVFAFNFCSNLLGWIMTNNFVVVNSTSLRLRRTTPEDLDFVLRAEQHEENRPFVIAWPRTQHHETLANTDLMHLICETVENARAVGYIILAGLQNANQAVEFRRLVITDKSHGFGREAVKLVKKLAFEKLNAHRLWLDVKEQNHRARRLYESEGFVVEGILRECLKTETGFDSLVVMSMLRNAYQDHF
jgi:RimJ/RimL family protein N-acetyltransferase